MSANVSTGGSNGPLSAGGFFTPVAVQAAAYSANPGELVPVDTTAGAVTVTLPAAPADGTTIAVKMVTQGSTNAVTVAAAGADVFNAVGGVTTKSVPLLSEGIIVQYKASVAIWYVLADSYSLASLDARYGKLSGATFTGVVTENGGTSTAGSAPILTGVAGTNGGAAVQLSDLTRDYMVYLEVGTAGTAWIVSMGHTSAGNDVTIHASGTATAGQVLSFRLPAGWYFLWSATTATLAQSVAVGC